MIYSWQILAIHRQAAPFIETVSNDGRKMLVRDQSKLGYEEVPETNGWEDDGGYGDYVLRCILLPIAPKRTSSTAL
jgi:hypothetical protein